MIYFNYFKIKHGVFLDKYFMAIWIFCHLPEDDCKHDKMLLINFIEILVFYFKITFLCHLLNKKSANVMKMIKLQVNLFSWRNRWYSSVPFFYWTVCLLSWNVCYSEIHILLIITPMICSSCYVKYIFLILYAVCSDFDGHHCVLGNYNSYDFRYLRLLMHV